MRYLTLLLLFLPVSLIAQPSEPVVIEAVITGYSSEVSQTDSTPFIMADNTRVEWTALACPRKYEFWTVVRIQGELFFCRDRMNLRYENAEYEHFDIWFETKKEAQEWGKWKLKIEIYGTK